MKVLKEVEDKVASVFNWFSVNYFKTNPKKYHFLVTSNKQVNLNLDDNFLTFNEHVSELCKKASQKCYCTYFKLYNK